MKILSVNAGSSSLKFKMYEMPEEKVLISGNIEKIGLPKSIWTIKVNGEEEHHDGVLKDHTEAVKVLISELLHHDIVDSLEEIKAIGHRIVNGGGKFKPTLVDEKELNRLKSIKNLSPVHMPGHIAGIEAFRKEIPNCKQYVLFDTSFHSTIPEENFMYPVPYEWYEKYGVRKYGFHGTSCKYITSEMEKRFKRKVNLIIVHMGSGASLTLVENSKSIDNSMGFTANCGVMMGTRCGTIDYSILPYIQDKTGLSLHEIDDILNYKSGLEGIYKGGSDYRDLRKGVEKNDKKAILAHTMYINRVVDIIGSYYLRLDRIDAIVFTAGVGENAFKFRESVINKLNKIGVKLDSENNENGEEIITTKDSSIPCYVLKTDEEVMIARDTYDQVK